MGSASVDSFEGAPAARVPPGSVRWRIGLRTLSLETLGVNPEIPPSQFRAVLYLEGGVLQRKSGAYGSAGHICQEPAGFDLRPCRKTTSHAPREHTAGTRTEGLGQLDSSGGDAFPVLAPERSAVFDQELR